MSTSASIPCGYITGYRVLGRRPFHRERVAGAAPPGETSDPLKRSRSYKPAPCPPLAPRGCVSVRGDGRNALLRALLRLRDVHISVRGGVPWYARNAGGATDGVPTLALHMHARPGMAATRAFPIAWIRSSPIPDGWIASLAGRPRDRFHRDLSRAAASASKRERWADERRPSEWVATRTRSSGRVAVRCAAGLAGASIPLPGHDVLAVEANPVRAELLIRRVGPVLRKRSETSTRSARPTAPVAVLPV